MTEENKIALKNAINNQMANIRETLSDNDGQLSTMRVKCFIALFVSITITYYSIWTKETASNLPLILSWLGFAFGGKVVQKFIEEKKKPEAKTFEDGK